MLKRVLFRAAAVAAALTLGSTARADFVIDDFTNPNPAPAFVTVTGSVTQTNTLTGAPGAPTRTLTVTETDNPGGNGETRYRVGQVAPGSGRLTLGTTDATGNVLAQYSYSTGQNLAAGGTSLQFTFATADFGVPYSVQLSDGTNTVTLSDTTTTGAGVYSFLTTDFLTGPGGPTGLNLSSITSVLLSLNQQLGGGSTAPVTSADFSLSDVRVLTPASPVVPAPPAAVLVLAAAPLLGLARARRVLPA